jgi:flavin reductase (DIM6/NTAB) family NADH-FMN oxidoreductase RutF
MTFDQRSFRTALSHFATGVVVVTASGQDGTAVGITVTSFNAVSLEPPLVLFSVARTALSLPVLQSADAYGISVLRQDQVDLSDRFARATSNKWQGVDVKAGKTGCPLIAPSLAHFECLPFNIYDGGDHAIFLGKVIDFEIDSSAAPLLFFRGKYNALDQSSAA